MTLSRRDFADFFQEVNDGYRPFGWQERLLDHLLEQGGWPEGIAAPTGSGKSNVVDIHVFATALSAEGVAPRLPRRMALVVHRRALVDSHYSRALRIQEALSKADGGILTTVRRSLERLVTATDGSFLVITEMRGGVERDGLWLEDPSACAVVCATPAMWGSRLLMRGYGSSAQARPREAGLLALDAVMVLDEAHLNRQLLMTARRVSELQQQFETDLGVPPLQVVETTATPAERTGMMVGVEPDDLTDDVLGPRLTRPKKVVVVPAKSWPGRTVPGRHIDQLVSEVLHAREAAAGGAIGCVVNRVETAIRVTQALKIGGLDTECWVGRMRPMDIQRLKDKHPELLDSSRKPRLDVLVATQTVEVGVDLDLAGLVTELASGSALAQRFGRVNRRGARPYSEVRVLAPESPSVDDYLPYKSADLTAAREWLNDLRETDGGGAPWNLVQLPPPTATPRRAIPMRVELHDLERWAATSDLAFAEEDLELWLSDDLEGAASDGGLIMRSSLPEDGTECQALLDATPPHASEVFPVSIWLLRIHVQRILDGENHGPMRAYVWRPASAIVQSGEVQSGGRGRLRQWGWQQVLSGDQIRPGETVCIDARHAVTVQSVVVDPEFAREERVQEGDPIETGWGEQESVKVLFRGQTIEGVEVADLDGLEPAEAQELLDAIGRSWDVTLSPGTQEGECRWVVLTRRSAIVNDEESRQTITCSEDPVTLEAHSSAVEERAGRLARRLELDETLTRELAQAGLLHDAGKADPRFQRALNPLVSEGEPLLAKGVQTSRQQSRRDRAASGLPTGWRHEHLSAGIARSEQASDLVVRLVGLSHGYGRGLAPNRADDLLTEGASDVTEVAVRELYDEGGWEELVQTTHENVGLWACCYLEAVLRAADCQVSKEGS